jgi:hypothetical protein
LILHEALFAVVMLAVLALARNVFRALQLRRAADGELSTGRWRSDPEPAGPPRHQPGLGTRASKFSFAALLASNPRAVLGSS